MSPTVSNTPLTNYTPATLTISGEEFQRMINSGPATTGSTTILDTTVTAVAGSKVAQDVAVKESALPTGASTAALQSNVQETDGTYGTFLRIGIPWQESGGPSSGIGPWPTIGDGQYACFPGVAVAGREASSGQVIPANVSDTTPGISADGIITRTFLYAIDTGLVPRSLKTDTNGNLLVMPAVGAVLAATQSGAWTTTQAYTPLTWGTPVSTVVTVAAQVVASNVNRKALQVYCSVGQIYYRFGANPSSTVFQGRLDAGQQITMGEGMTSTQSFCAIAVGATATVLTTEAT